MRKYEIGGVLCCKGNKCDKIPLYSQGDHNKVTMPIRCRPGYKPAMVFHTHPDGVASPSRADVVNLRKVGVPLGCIANKPSIKAVKCFRV